MYKNFVPLHLHSEYSLRDSGATINDIVKKCIQLGFNACAITEHGNMHSSLPFYKACNNSWRMLADKIAEKYNVPASDIKAIKGIIPDRVSIKNAIGKIGELSNFTDKHPDYFKALAEKEVKPILGVEAYIIPTEEMINSEDKDISGTRFHLTLLAKNAKGYKSLIKAVSESYMYQHKSPRSVFPRMTYSLLEKHFKEGDVIALSGCIHGEIPNLLSKEMYDEAMQKVCYFQSLFGKDNFYLEIQDHKLTKEVLIRAKLIELSKDTGVKLVATNDSHYIEKEDANVRDMIVAMRLNKIVNEPDYDKDCGELYIKSKEEMLELFADIPESVYATSEVADKCNVEIEKQTLTPSYKTIKGETETQAISRLVKEGLKRRYPDFSKWKQKYKDMFIKRIQYELQVISKLKYEGYLLIVQDFIRKGREIGLVGPGRGSAVGSLVCYLLEITDVNPIKYGLLFERFLNPDRVSPPDIDTDFDTEIRDMVIEYVKEVYGSESVCNIATFGTLAARASIRYAGRVTGIPLNICDKVAKLIPEQPGISLEEAYNNSKELQELYIKDPEVQELFENAKRLEGSIVQSGTHAAGVIIANCDVTDHIPLMYDLGSKSWVSQYDKDVCENDAGLMKMDFLGLENLTIIKRTLKHIQKNHGKTIDIRKLPLDDKDVIREIFARGKTKAIFQFESQGMMALLQKFIPQSLEDLILLNAAYRPGPLQYLDEIIEVKHKRKEPYYIIPQLERILGITYGKPIYQEQIMRIFNEIGGFSLGEADIIRRAMSKKKMSELEQYLPAFEEKLIQAGASSREAIAFSQELMEFANYAFNKSHSAAYSVLAYQTAWLKYYYPVEYMASILTSASIEKLPFYIKECANMGIPVIPPSINKSERFFAPDKDGKIRFGLEGVKNAGNCWEDILIERERGGEYQSFQEYLDRLIKADSRAVNKSVITSLIHAGAFDEFGHNRRQMIEGFEKYVKAVKDYNIKIKSPKTKAKTLEKALEKIQQNYFDDTISEYNKAQLLENEKAIIGFFASGHPLDEYKDILQGTTNITVSDIDDSLIEKQILLAGRISDLKKLQRKSDKASMCKFALEDITGHIDVMCFVKPYESHKDKIKVGNIVKLTGKVSTDTSAERAVYQIFMQEVEPLVCINTN